MQNLIYPQTYVHWSKVLTFLSQDQATLCMESNILNSCVDLDDSHRFGSSDKAYMPPIWYFHHKQSTPCFWTIVTTFIRQFWKVCMFLDFFQFSSTALCACRTLVQCPLNSRAIFMYLCFLRLFRKQYTCHKEQNAISSHDLRLCLTPAPET